MASEMCVGIDVANRESVISSDHGWATIANTQGVIERWLTALPKRSRIVVETTSHYHELVICVHGADETLVNRAVSNAVKSRPK